MTRARRGVRSWSVLAALALLAGWLPISPGPIEAEGIAPQPARGKFLVAARGLRDPNFDQSVVLLLEYSSDGAMGVIVNRPTEMKLSLLLPNAEGIDDRPDFVYEGGPVMPGGMLVLLRTEEEIEDARRVLDDVQATPSREVLESRIASGFPPERMRAYFGHAGWAPGQLDAEVARGGWLILAADADAVFDAEPSELWHRLIRRDSDLVVSLDGGTPFPAPIGAGP